MGVWRINFLITDNTGFLSSDVAMIEAENLKKAKSKIIKTYPGAEIQFVRYKRLDLAYEREVKRLQKHL